MQRIIFALERCLIHVRSAQQPAIQLIAPAVVWALNAPREFSVVFAAHPRPAMPADIVESTQHSSTVARCDNALARHFAQKIVAGILNLLFAPGTHPHSAEEPLQLLAKYFRVGVVPRRQRHLLRAHGRLQVQQSSLTLARFATNPISSRTSTE